MDLDSIALFVETIQQGSITKAASALNKPKSTISRQLSEFEHRLGVKLINRTTRKLALTEAGQHLYQHSFELIKELGEIQESIGAYQRQPKGQLKLLWPQELFTTQMSELISEFVQAWPQIRLYGSQYTGAIPELDAQFDLHFFLHQKPLPASDWIARTLMSIPNGLYTASRAKLPAPSSLAELGSYPCILQTDEEQWLFRKGHEIKAASVSGRLILNSTDMRLRAAIQGQGVTRLPHYLAEPHVRRGTLVQLQVEERPEADLLTVVYRNRQLPLKTKLFLEHFQTHLGRLYSEV